MDVFTHELYAIFMYIVIAIFSWYCMSNIVEWDGWGMGSGNGSTNMAASQACTICSKNIIYKLAIVCTSWDIK